MVLAMVFVTVVEYPLPALPACRMAERYCTVRPPCARVNVPPPVPSGVNRFSSEPAPWYTALSTQRYSSSCPLASYRGMVRRTEAERFSAKNCSMRCVTPVACHWAPGWPFTRLCSVSSTTTSSNSDWKALAFHTLVAAASTASVMRLDKVPPLYKNVLPAGRTFGVVMSTSSPSCSILSVMLPVAASTLPNTCS